MHLPCSGPNASPTRGGYSLRVEITSVSLHFQLQIFPIDWLNSQLNSFQYTYLENDKPQLIQKSDILSEIKLKQESPAIAKMTAQCALYIWMP